MAKKDIITKDISEEIDKIVEEKIGKLVEDKIENYCKGQHESEPPTKKFTLIKVEHISPGGEEERGWYDCDYWFEDALLGGSVIVFGDLDENNSMTIPYTEFRGVRQNFEVREDIEKYAQFNEKMKRRKELMEAQMVKDSNRDVA